MGLTIHNITLNKYVPQFFKKMNWQILCRGKMNLDLSCIVMVGRNSHYRAYEALYLRESMTQSYMKKGGLRRVRPWQGKRGGTCNFLCGFFTESIQSIICYVRLCLCVSVMLPCLPLVKAPPPFCCTSATTHTRQEIEWSLICWIFHEQLPIFRF